MTKVWIDADERYPTYGVRGDQHGYQVEVTDEQLTRWQAAEAAYEVAQSEMGELFEAARKVDEERRAAEKAKREAREKAERAERRRASEEAAAAREAATQRLLGTVYDADGVAVGEVTRGPSGVKIAPIVRL